MISKRNKCASGLFWYTTEKTFIPNLPSKIYFICCLGYLRTLATSWLIMLTKRLMSLKIHFGNNCDTSVLLNK